jgi:lysyl-tRNA synthetase class 1
MVYAIEDGMPEMIQRHWADTIAEQIVQQRGTTQVVSTGITPSGEIHVGNMREVVTADAIYRALKDIGVQCRFNYVSDTYDPLRRVYPFLDAKLYTKEVGKPLSEIPCPCGAHSSYAEHFLLPFVDALRELGIAAEVIRADQLYKAGAFAEVILLALEKRDHIAQILREETGREVESTWSPFDPICQSCGRLTETEVTGFSAAAGTVSYRCTCGATGSVPLAGGGKLTWRVDWPARWKILDVTVEPFGKDHASKGGSYDTGKRIAREVFGIEPPFPITYEWISLQGRGDMSKSKGNVMSINAVLEVVPPEVLRYFVLRAPLQKSIGFDPGLPLLRLIDEYDDVESSERNSRALELSQIRGIEPVGIPYRHMVTLTQIAQGDVDRLLTTVKRSGYPVAHPTAVQKRAEYAKRWLEKFAPEEMKFAVQEEIPAAVQDLSPAQKTFLRRLGEQLQPGMDGDQIHQLIYTLKDEFNLKPAQAFQAIYLALLGKGNGPRAGWFLSTLDCVFVQRRFAAVGADAA